MQMTKKSKVKFKLSAIPNLAQKVWEKVGDVGDFQWALPENWQTIESIVGQEKCNDVINIQNSALRNREIRNLISPYLRSTDLIDRKKIADWIIYSWGGITRGKSSSEKWTKIFGNYEEETVNAFINANEQYRIASWSKVLAFADMKKYAVYDAWTATSLNIILDDIGYVNRFYMPPPRSELLPDLNKVIRKDMRNKFEGKKKVYMGYFDYMELLKAIVDYGYATDVLEVEMCIFANGDRLCRYFADKHDLI